MNTSFISQDTMFPSYSVPTDLHLFPGSFEDVDHDGTKDLVYISFVGIVRTKKISGFTKL